MVPALVLSAGHGTRLRPLSLVRAKAALPLAGEALIHRILRWLVSSGVHDVVINLHHLPHTLTAIVGDGSDLNVRVRYSWESPVLGSAGGPRRALPLLGAQTFLIINGDTLTDLDPNVVVADHERSGALVTMAVVPNRAPHKYGGLLIDADGSFIGSTRPGSPQPSYHFFGVQVADAEAFRSVPPETPYETVLRLYPDLAAARPGSVRALVTTAESLDIGTCADYLDTSLLLGARERHSATIHARVHESARVERSVLWDDVEVGAGAMLRECVVADGVRVPADTSWHGVTIRVASGELADGERRINGLAIAGIPRQS